MSSTAPDRSLLVLVLDVTPSVWGERDLRRTASDKARVAKGKTSVGPARLDEVLSSVLAFSVAFSTLNRENVVVIVAVAGDETAIVYPRKAGPMSMTNAVEDASEIGAKVDAGRLHRHLTLGVAELSNRAAERDEAAAAGVSGASSGEGDATSSSSSSPTTKASRPGAAIAAGVSIGLCTINRFMVAAHGGVSALADGSSSLLQRRDDDGVLAMLGGGGSRSGASRRAADERDGVRRARGMPCPRILVVQSSDDRTADYNALMNCAFASSKEGVTVDGCFIPSGMAGHGKTSPFLEQVVDRTAGVYLAVPSGAAQVGGALTEVLMSVFLPPPSARRRLNLPALTKVDFRARCFETGESVDIASVCNQCLSIFKDCPQESCPTCGAIVRKEQERGPKRAKPA